MVYPDKATQKIRPYGDGAIDRRSTHQQGRPRGLLPMASGPALTVPQRARTAVDQLTARVRERRAGEVARYFVGALAAVLVLEVGYFAALFAPTRDISYRMFNGLPGLIHGGDGTIAGIVAPSRPGREPRWWWLAVAGWWLGLMWVTLAWFPLLFRPSVPLAMSMLAATDNVLFMPKVRVKKKVIVEPETPPEQSATADAAFARVQIPKSVRFRVLDRDGYRCRYCGNAASDGAQLHIDHVLPVIRGGTNDEMNLVAACQDCNLGKGARMVTSQLPLVTQPDSPAHPW